MNLNIHLWGQASIIYIIIKEKPIDFAELVIFVSILIVLA